MADIMEGVRILEVAEHTFVPAASAILADWGAEVIKIEHPERGDAMRGLASSGVMPSMGDVHVLLEHSNRGKKSIGIDVSTERASTSSTGWRDVRRLPHEQAARRAQEAPIELEDIARTTPTSSTWQGPAAASAAPRPTAGATTS